MARWFWTSFLALTCESARVVNTNGLLPVIPPGHEDPNPVSAIDPIAQADGQVVQSVSWDVAEDFNLARARARERREQRMAAQQAMAAKAQAEAEAKVKAAWEKNAHKNELPQAKVSPPPSSTVVHLVRKPRPHISKKQSNHTSNRTNHTVGVKNVSNTSHAQMPDPALDGLDHIAQKVAHFGEALETFTRAQAAKGKKAQKLPPQVEKIMENAEDLMKKIIAVADDKAIDVPELNTKKANATIKGDLESAPPVKVETNATSNPGNLTATVAHSASGTNASINSSNATRASKAPQSNDTTIHNKTNAANMTLVMPSRPSNTTNVASAKASNATVLAGSKNVTQVSNTVHNVTLKVSSNTTTTATSKESASTAGSKPATNGTTLGNLTVKAAVTHKINNITENASATTKSPSVTPTHFNKPDRMVHSALGAARLAAAKLRGMRAPTHKPVKADDSWKVANSVIDSRIVGLKAAKDEALQADDHDLADSLQEKIKGLQAEAAENEAKAKKVKGKHHR
eukprot:gnl/MRDRNA2_/MRDRNA2_92785_c0_seq1.p1 gnl/MRDRNA2_/MRDRNA2_92785_c0~~gnl/MRDRNA2_/MRDRNA2_92785_c0_seq1.p1  ORF type:complete len:515 (+),score=128.05 gnl/MRDRNA2_/MRDRNA2_92785_c0_seq1:155-1699(+)